MDPSGSAGANLATYLNRAAPPSALVKSDGQTAPSALLRPVQIPLPEAARVPRPKTLAGPVPTLQEAARAQLARVAPVQTRPGFVQPRTIVTPPRPMQTPQKRMQTPTRPVQSPVRPHPGDNPGADRWFLQSTDSTPMQMPPESGGICGRLS